MLKRIIQVSCLVITVASSIGCTLSHQPPTCEQLKRQWLYSSTNPSAINGIDRDKLQQKMAELNCQ
jgi:hypothetical protein